MKGKYYLGRLRFNGEKISESEYVSFPTVSPTLPVLSDSSFHRLSLLCKSSQIAIAAHLPPAGNFHKIANDNCKRHRHCIHAKKRTD